MAKRMLLLMHAPIEVHALPKKKMEIKGNLLVLITVGVFQMLVIYWQLALKKILDLLIKRTMD